ncbi:MAG TPA: hypothetical protein VFY49_18355 [Myxococcota bacterium]|nr:hypothetical protein [Myxococcota bacterium]
MLHIHRAKHCLHAKTRAWCAVLPLACASAAAAQPAPAPLAEIDRRIELIEVAVAEAHFRSALGLTRSALGLLDPDAPRESVAPRRARLEVLAATAEVARGRKIQARDHLVRALCADPSLALDERETSPRLLALLPEARRLAARAEVTR